MKLTLCSMDNAEELVTMDRQTALRARARQLMRTIASVCSLHVSSGNQLWRMFDGIVQYNQLMPCLILLMPYLMYLMPYLILSMLWSWIHVGDYPYGSICRNIYTRVIKTRII